MRHYLVLLTLFLFTQISFSQTTYLVKGRVTDSENGDPIPFANIIVKGTTIGTVCDFDGYFNLKIPKKVDSLSSIYIGYQMRTKKLLDVPTQTLNFQLKESGIELKEVVIRPGENPAWPILRNVIRNKEFNDKRSLISYEYEAYNKFEVDIDKLSDRFKKKKLIKKIQNVLDSIGKVTGEDGNPVLPFFVSETISKLYFKADPDKFKEFIEKTKISGLGSNEGSVVSQLVGSSFQDYNFYRNWLNIVNKDFVSPIADGWKIYYDYLLEDSTLQQDGDWIYRIEVTPKRPQDLAFKGTIWINRSDWALTRVDLVIPKEANINFIDKIKIQQQLTKTSAGPYLPAKNRVTIDIANLNKNWAGMIAKFYTSAKDFVVNKPMGADFYEKPIELDDNIHISDQKFWNDRRHDTLSITERNVFKMIDTVKKIPAVRTYVEIVNILVNGYKRIDNLDFGPYIYTYGWNNVEGHRIRLGFRTNQFFSRKWVYSGYVAYGTRDEQWKYGFDITHIFSRKRWTTASIEHRYELEQLALIDNSLATNSLFFAFTRLGDLDNTRPYYSRNLKLNFSREVRRGLTINVQSNLYNFQPQTDLYKFAFYNQPRHGETGMDSTVSRTFEAAEFMAEVRYGRDEQFIENENRRISLGATRWPILSLKYSAGIKGVALGTVFNSDLNYHKVQFSATQFVRYGLFGNGKISLVGGYTPSIVPYPILRSHLGNQTLFLNLSAFNMMQFFEFVSDRFVSVNYQHNFEGLGLNSLPLIRKLKWRFVATGNILFGSVQQKNFDLIPTKSGDIEIQGFQSLDLNKPYAEVGYGVENIFRLLRVDFVHRLTYLDNPGAKRFGVKFSVQFKL
jgi:hypothetical protein